MIDKRGPPDPGVDHVIYYNLFHYSRDGLLLLERFEEDTSCLIVRANPAALALLGVEEEELEGHPVKAALPGIAGTKAAAWLSNPPESWPAHPPAPILYQDQKIRLWLEFRLHPLPDTHLLLVILDVTADIEARQARDTVLRELETTFNAITDGIALLDLSGRFLRVNPQLASMLGIPQAELLEEQTCLKIHGCDRTESQCPFTAMKRSLKRESRFFHVRSRILEAIADPVFDASGTLIGAVHLFKDVTDAHRTAERLDLALEASSIGLWEWNIQTDEIWYSPHWMRQIGYEPGELPSVFSTWESRLHPEDRNRTLTYVETFFSARQERYELEFRFLHRDGHYFWVLSKAVVVLDSSGKPIRLLGTHQDITRFKNAEQALRQAEEASRQNATRLQSLVLLSQLPPNLTESEIAQRTIEEAVRLTNSVNGYFHSPQAAPEAPFRLAWHRPPHSLTVDPDQIALECGRLQGAIVRNTPPGPESGTSPIRQISVAVIENSMVRLVLSVFNKSESYDDSDIQQLQLLANDIWKLICRKRNLQELERYRLGLEELVSKRTSELERLNLDLMHQNEVRRQTEEKLLVFQQFAEEANQGLIMVTPDGWLTYLNRWIRFLIQLDRIRDRRILKLADLFLPEETHRMETEILPLVREGSTWTGELLLCGDGNTSIPVLGAFFLIRDKNNTTRYIASIITDISYQKAITRELMRARDASDIANRAKSLFLANMSHEIRTPMHAILGFAQLLRRDPALRPGQLAHVDTIMQAGEHLLSLIDGILEMSRIEAGKAQYHPHEIHLPHLLSEVERMVRIRAATKQIDFEMQLAQDLPRDIVTDEVKLRQLLVNLLGNAVKFTERGSVVLRVTASPFPDGTPGLRFDVEDTGPGLTEEEIGQLFKPFSQTAAGMKSGGGTGLGLSLSREFAHLLGGEITVYSQPGQGAVFSLVLPLTSAVSPARGKQSPSGERIIGLPAHQRPPLVLIVDDQEGHRTLLQRLCGSVGLLTRIAVTAGEGLRIIEGAPPDLVLMDLKMPGMSGFDAIRAIRAMKGAEKLPIIAITADAFEEVRQRAIDAGADGFLRKPFLEQELFRLMEALLGISFLRETAAESRSAERIGGRDPQADELRHLSPQVRKRLLEAVLIADQDGLLAQIEALEGAEPQAAAGLRRLVLRLEYDKLLRLLSPEPE
ncbi:MAG TPA: PAS domain S-box protein [Candidatus Ozemobacteraceae bacterium]